MKLLLSPKGVSWETQNNLLQDIIESIIVANPLVVEQYRAGKESAIGFFVGQVMKQMGGRVDPVVAKAKLEEGLKG